MVSEGSLLCSQKSGTGSSRKSDPVYTLTPCFLKNHYNYHPIYD
jgi:hypothetical protein